jgi:RNA-directed DNA polymerase
VGWKPEANRRTASDLSASAADASRLLDAVASPVNLATALLNVVRNKGAPGVDGRSVEEVLGFARSLLPRLQRALLDGTKDSPANGTSASIARLMSGS